MSTAPKDEPLDAMPVVQKLEKEAIALFRAKYPDAPLWQDLDDSTRLMWVTHAEKAREETT